MLDDIDIAEVKVKADFKAIAQENKGWEPKIAVTADEVDAIQTVIETYREQGYQAKLIRKEDGRSWLLVKRAHGFKFRIKPACGGSGVLENK